MTFSDAGFLGVLRVKESLYLFVVFCVENCRDLQVAPDKRGYPVNIFLISHLKYHWGSIWVPTRFHGEIRKISVTFY